MDKITKTIRMPAATLAAWLDALRSGNYAQANGTLHNKANNSYCCLGVLQVVACGSVETDSSGRACAVPSRKWLKDHGIRFLWSDGDEDFNPWLSGSSAAGLNDAGVKFDELADILERHAETY